MASRERAERMVDFGLEEAKITFDIGPEPTQEEIDAAAKEIEEMTADKSVSVSVKYVKSE